VVPENIHTPTTEGHLEIPRRRGGGALKVKIFKGMYAGAKLEFPEGWGFKPKNPLWGEYGYFLEQHNSTLPVLTLKSDHAGCDSEQTEHVIILCRPKIIKCEMLQINKKIYIHS